MDNNNKKHIMLSDVQILERLVADDPNCIFISPIVDPSKQLGPSSIDIHIGYQYKVITNFSATHIDLTLPQKDRDYQIDQYYSERRISPYGHYVLHPGEFALGTTLEFIHLPDDIAGRIEGRSSIARLGFKVHATAGFIDPGFRGYLTYELQNAGKLPIKFAPGIRIGQLCFFQISDVQMPYGQKDNSQFMDQRSPRLKIN